MRYDETIRYLYSLRTHGIKLGLDNIRILSASLGNPHASFRSVHVAGTNGKGSTSAIIASILRSAGLTVGLFTSPHLVNFTERIRVNGEEIDESAVIRLAEDVRVAASRHDGLSPTFFEVVTAMALLHFSRRKVDVAVMEVGMGGRLDATNIIRPDVCVITQVGDDHRDYLGNTLADIAGEKAGIVKKGVPLVTASQVPEVLAVLSSAARSHDAPLGVFGDAFSARLTEATTRGISFDYADSEVSLRDLFLPLAGAHQLENAALAIRTSKLFLGEIASLQEIVRDGLAKTAWPGRLELIDGDPPLLLDGAHNPPAALALSRALSDIFLARYGSIVLVLGIMGDKDIDGIMRPLLPLASDVILTRPSYKRAASVETMVRIATGIGHQNVHAAPSVGQAIDTARSIARDRRSGDVLIVITGSFYTIGEAKESLGHKGILTRLRE